VTATEYALALTTAAAEAAGDKLARDLVAFDVSDRLVITDVFLVCSAANDRQVRAVVDAIEERLLPMGAKPVRREGQRESRWVLLDFVDIVVHVQSQQERAYYALERIWRDCPEVVLPEAVTQAARGEAGR
jgi:ribosome-associated protein